MKKVTKLHSYDSGYLTYYLYKFLTILFNVIIILMKEVTILNTYHRSYLTYNL